MPEPLRIVIAEDNYLVREGVRRLLEESGEVVVAAAVGSAPELLDAVGRLLPDAVLTDIRMPLPGRARGVSTGSTGGVSTGSTGGVSTGSTGVGSGPELSMEGIEAAHRIRADHPGVGVVILSQYADEAYALALFRDGTEGLAYLLKDRVSEVTRLLGALHEVARGGSVIDPQVVEALVARRARVRESPIGTLNPRELDVLRAMAEGRTNRAVAADLHLSESTVEKHVNAIFTKLGLSAEPEVHRRVAAVLAYLDDNGRASQAARGTEP